MCKYTVFNFLCGAQKLKIVSTCSQAKTNYQGLLFCQDDPHAHISDGKSRDYADQTYGPGVCANVNCRTAHGMAPRKQVDFKERDLIEDDRDFDMSPEACAEREERWYRQCLSTHQQLEVIGAQMPPAVDALSSYAKWWIYIENMPADWVATWEQLSLVDNPDEISFLELNPRYMTQRALHHVTGHYLPANITDTRHSRHKVDAVTTTPRMPALGPFKTKSHTCKPNVGYCKTGGDYHGKEYSKKPHKYTEATFVDLLQALANDRATDLSGLGVDMPHVRPTLNMPTPFHGNNFNRKALTFEDTGKMVDDFMVDKFGLEYQTGNPAALAVADAEDEMPFSFDDTPYSDDSSATADAQLVEAILTSTTAAEHAVLDGMQADDALGGPDDESDAMMLDI
ncbi:hypothetical protein CLAFUW4_05648 [Fulvia fulva]|uniref:Uncharacterized protein n=1 Tax=Passalora fulva TaxID=5499 RepID=A0A9Q8P908_PASFU|nr:uncharacterized protein CLAFUR5_05789 [Fulvia fulva]KAK4624659.1 hypothetical protein CLAFUR4_05643 [Fulvia fulva]KAK4625108.1 hypothetical protein CLAFUR0_05651 [Fulvia fulva]UJO17461.1 hypothetical protein CLAFUR5_05789 [Fulvia fulva]WPV14442.1 hypothetical protein CLAFUW4_05648 [Fulvia fulva]WPV29783.1 hypothetical protein CLAFUW7_05647 [Fulvia fulva]